MVDDVEAGTRFTLTQYAMGATIGITIIVMALSAFNVAVPEFVSGVIIMGFMNILKDAYFSYFKAREDAQIAKAEVAKVQAAQDVVR